MYVATSPPECRSKSARKNSKQIGRKYITAKIFGDNSNKSNFDSGET
jgi:hypothetical protein